MVINPLNYKVEWTEVFDTYTSSNRFDEFISLGFPNGYIIVVACQDECSYRLSDTGRQFFKSMGSTAIKEVDYRCGFVFIGTFGQ